MNIQTFGTNFFFAVAAFGLVASDEGLTLLWQGEMSK